MGSSQIIRPLAAFIKYECEERRDSAMRYRVHQKGQYTYVEESPRGFASLFVLVPIGIIFFGLSNSSSYAEKKVAEKAACYKAFEAAGMTEQEAEESSDRTVLEVCGTIPDYEVNSVWDTNRDRPQGLAAQDAELKRCYKVFEAQGLTSKDANQASEEQLVELCETVPDLLD
jgi:hypothetical protein